MTHEVQPQSASDRLYAALGLAVAKAAELEVTVAEYAILRHELTGTATALDSRLRISGQVGSQLEDRLREVGEDDVADRYRALAARRNHVVHGVWWDLFGDGSAEVVRQPRKVKGTLANPAQETWDIAKLRDLAKQCYELDTELFSEILTAGRYPAAFGVGSEREYAVTEGASSE